VGAEVSVQGVTALITAVTSLIVAAGAVWHSVQTRKKIK